MSSEDRELLARIGQLAGQINRHKSQQALPRPAPTYPPNPGFRSHPYQRGAHRGRARGRGSHTHQHRTLHLNSSASASGQTTPNEGTSADASQWVSRTDRHRQLINASVYEKDSQTRAKAIEETRRQNATGHRRGEKARFREYMNRQAQPLNLAGNTNSKSTASSNEIVIEGIRFRVLDGGKKLGKIRDDSNSMTETPKTAVVAGVKFHRTKTGNLVVHRIVQDHRRSGVVKKINEPCKIFSTTGSCPKGPKCRYIHDPEKVALCKAFLKEGRCAFGDECDLSHKMTPERVPDCLHFAKGNCAKPDCPYTHSTALPGALVCKAFGFLGYCVKGAECTERHVSECPNFSNTGRCNIKGCKLLHRERANVLRKAARDDHETTDVSSDDERADSDDVDSDDVAEFIAADSDASDSEDQDFIAV